jgi:anti-sigma28 factor (negative regulator of flagellin synthesis)
MSILNDLLGSDDQYIVAAAEEVAALIKQKNEGKLSTDEFAELSQSALEMSDVVKSMADLQRIQRIKAALENLLAIVKAVSAL